MRILVFLHRVDGPAPALSDVLAGDRYARPPLCKPPSRAGVSGVSAVCGFSWPWISVSLDFHARGLRPMRRDRVKLGCKKVRREKKS